MASGGDFLPECHDAHPAASPPARVHSNSAVTAKTHDTKPVAHKTVPAGPPEAVIRLTAAQDCWVGLNSPSGKTIYRGVILAGATKTWNEKSQVSMVIGNPPGVTLTVNGKHQQMSKVNVVTLSINPLSKTPVTIG